MRRRKIFFDYSFSTEQNCYWRLTCLRKQINTYRFKSRKNFSHDSLSFKIKCYEIVFLKKRRDTVTFWVGFYRLIKSKTITNVLSANAFHPTTIFRGMIEAWTLEFVQQFTLCSYTRNNESITIIKSRWGKFLQRSRNSSSDWIKCKPKKTTSAWEIKSCEDCYDYLCGRSVFTIVVL